MQDSLNNTNDTLAKLAAEVLKQYDMTPREIKLIQGDSIKTVWKIQADGKHLCLKRLKQSMDKALFSINAQIYVRKSGGFVPEVFLSKGGSVLVQHNDQLFVLYEWINGRDLDFGNPSDLRSAMHGLAGFHIASKGYVPQENCRISTKLGKWPEQYISMQSKLAEWKETARRQAGTPYFSAYLKCVDPVIEICKQATEALNRSYYSQLTAEGSQSIVLCHQDYGRGNAILCNGAVYILDLDGVTFDLPARDLRKIIGKNAENRGLWNSQAINDILGWYEEINPMNKKEKEVLFIDMLFPHWFYGLVKNIFKGGKALKPSEIEKIAKLEESKVPLLKNLIDKEHTV